MIQHYKFKIYKAPIDITSIGALFVIIIVNDKTLHLLNTPKH